MKVTENSSGFDLLVIKFLFSFILLIHFNFEPFYWSKFFSHNFLECELRVSTLQDNHQLTPRIGPIS